MARDGDGADARDTARLDANRVLFRECFSAVLIERLAPVTSTASKASRRRRAGRRGKGVDTRDSTTTLGDDDGDGADVAALSEFTEYLSDEIFAALPEELRSLSYAATQSDVALAELYGAPLGSNLTAALTEKLPAPISDSLVAYGAMSEANELQRLLTPALDAYATAAAAAPAAYMPGSRASECEICGREHLPLTYHHLIPRAVQAKAVKRGWHAEWEVGKVAWLCRACHSFVHRVADNEQLAREGHSVELLLQRDDVRSWAAWVGRVRWKAR